MFNKTSHKILFIASLILLAMVMAGILAFVYFNQVGSFATTTYTQENPSFFGISKEKYDKLIKSGKLKKDSLLYYEAPESSYPVRVYGFKDAEIAEKFVCSMWLDEKYIQAEDGDVCEASVKGEEVFLRDLDHNLMDDSTAARDVIYRLGVNSGNYYVVTETQSRVMCARGGMPFVWTTGSCA